MEASLSIRHDMAIRPPKCYCGMSATSLSWSIWGSNFIITRETVNHMLELGISFPFSAESSYMMLLYVRMNTSNNKPRARDTSDPLH